MLAALAEPAAIAAATAAANRIFLAIIFPFVNKSA
jgi:hypothetical protein